MKPSGITQARGHRGDYVLALTVFILLAFGLIMMYNINPALSQNLGGPGGGTNYFRSQLLNIAVGIIAALTASSIYFARWRRYAGFLLVVAVLMIMALAVPGLHFTANGATRWLRLGPFSFQPAELLKLGLVVYLAAWFEAKRKEELTSLSGGVVPFGIMIAIASVIVVVFQRDLGSMLVLAMAALGMYFVAGIR
ncbi:MAG TPA: FtsW/RodA/SpoVE family cell cycle protein, partial [Candidatus Saccharimonadales bacterium]|nr:FtsW/RodA/SpoVE family cell cycle protein [Candidatus Saccharimonadales bacterium]